MDLEDELDDVAVATLRAASISDDVLKTLSRDDIRDLFPGPEHFLRRKAIWSKIHVEDRGEEHATAVAEPPRAEPVDHVPEKFLKFSSIEYVLYTDSELEQARRLYFEKQRLGEEHEVTLSKELYCRLTRNTMTNMVAVARASESRYPTKHEILSMAKRLVEYYPMIKDPSPDSVWEDVLRKLMKRLSNVKSPVKKKSPVVRRRPSDGNADDSISSAHDSISSAHSDGNSSASTVILENSPPRPRTSTPKRPRPSLEQPGVSGEMDSEKAQARHYRTLKDMYKSKTPNKAAVSHLLDLEFQARRQFINQVPFKEQDRAGKILEAYPCFREIDHIMDELRRIIDPQNVDFVAVVKERWAEFCSKVPYYAVTKNLMKPPQTLDSVEHATAVYAALPQLFPSPASAPKKARAQSGAIFHALPLSESPDAFLQSQGHPIVLLGEENCLLAIGPTPLCPFPRDQFFDSILYLMGCYYVFHLTYPKSLATLLSVIQTEILQDALHERDVTLSYKKAIADWKAFVD